METLLCDFCLNEKDENEFGTKASDYPDEELPSPNICSECWDAMIKGANNDETIC